MFAGRHCRITIDHLEQIVRFENFRLLNSQSRSVFVCVMLSPVAAIRPMPEQVYYLHDILRVRRVHHFSGLAHLHIDTVYGRIVVSKYGQNFKDLELHMHAIARLLSRWPLSWVWAYKRVLIPALVVIILILLLLTFLLDQLRPILDGLG